MLKIWGRTNSSNVKKVLWCVEELGLTYERIDAGGAFGVVNDPAYRALNPNGLVPCIEDDGFVLWESNAIVRYLAEGDAERRLVPATRQAKASAERWMDWTTSTIAGPFRDVFWNVVRRTAQDRVETELSRGLDSCSRLLAIADKALAGQPYLSGDKFGIGDIPLGCLAYGWFNMPIERPDLPHLAAWYERLTERPAYRKAVMIPLT
ncbi:glutathione S-transferase [Labrys neptuniae]|uniref:Glutathione S-transferase n=1 Tax=Labrys neptuniae TaxID=376174 RepID=A0ABV3PSK4_9HYPH|nr:glutathione S-transferase [Labrys neptuniae]MDT3381606.1 glutathione S-transferase [Labrys neptuniae]